ncbi:MAG: DUF3187 family protein [Spartobacteria bacterium]|nr:DUF3187 family protein [Spartobacteria bacterium]
MRAPPPIFVACALLVATGVPPAARAGDPFLIRNDQPVGRLYGVPVGVDADPAAAPGFGLRVGLDVANGSIETSAGPAELTLDGETWVLRFAGRHVWKNGWRVMAGVPVVSHQGGGTDSFIEEYHDAMGLPDGNRKRRPADRLEYRYRRNDETMFSQTDSTTGLGDVFLAVAAPLVRDRAGTRALDAVAGVELPTGDSDRLLGSGSWDFSLGLAAADFATLAKWNLELHGGAGVLALTEGDVLADFQEPVAVYGDLAVGWRLASWLVPRVQIDFHSPFFAGTGQGPLDDWAVELVCGATVLLPGRFALDLAVAEDVAVHTAPDVVFHVGLKRSL